MAVEFERAPPAHELGNSCVDPDVLQHPAAGDLRVQLVVDDAVAASTVDHTMGNLHPRLAGEPR
jgi:hypothetical protein